jgi:hypothetical protein
MAGGQGLEHLAPAIVPPEQGGVAAHCGDPPAQGFGGQVGAQPAQGAAPLGQDFPRQVQGRGGGGQGNAPERPFTLEKREGLFPRGQPGGFRDLVAAQPIQGGLDALAAAAQAHMEAAGVIQGAAQGQGQTAPCDLARGGGFGTQLEHPGAFLGRARQDFQRDFQQHAQGAEGAGHQARQVVARHVLHDLAAKAQHLAAPVEQLHAQHRVAHRPAPGPARPGQAGGDHAAEGGVRAKVGRLERQQLPVPGKQGLDFRQRCAGPGGDHQFRGLVADDAAMAGNVQQLPIAMAPIERLAAATPDAQGHFVGRGPQDTFAELCFVMHRGAPSPLTGEGWGGGVAASTPQGWIRARPRFDSVHRCSRSA